MRYNAIAFGADIGEGPLLGCDQWFDSKEEAIEEIKEQTDPSRFGPCSRGLVIDFRTKIPTIIYEHTLNDIITYPRIPTPNQAKT